MKKLSMATLCLMGGLLAACSQADQPTSTTTSTAVVKPSATVAAIVVATPVPAPSVVRTETRAHTDGSQIVIRHHSDNSRHELRTFTKGPLVSVKRETKADGTVTAHVVHREDNVETEIKDKPWIEKAMDATGDALAKGVKKTKDVGEKVGETAAKDAKAVGSAVKEGAEAVGSEVKKDAKEVGRGAKKVGEKVKKAATN